MTLFISNLAFAQANRNQQMQNTRTADNAFRDAQRYAREADQRRSDRMARAAALTPEQIALQKQKAAEKKAEKEAKAAEKKAKKEAKAAEKKAKKEAKKAEEKAKKETK